MYLRLSGVIANLPRDENHLNHFSAKFEVYA